MGRTQEHTPFYIRTNGGDTFFVDTLDEALEQFTSDDGYRLTLQVGKNMVVIRRYLEVDSTTPGTRVFDSQVSIRKEETRRLSDVK